MIQNCDYCQSETYITRNRLAACQIKKCQNCGLTWRAPRLSVAELGEVYRAEEFSANFEDQREIYEEKEKMTNAFILDYLIDDLEFVAQETNLLDVGCGFGFFLRAAEARGFRAQGLEPSPEIVAEARKLVSGEIKEGLVETVEYPAASFDVILMADVLEHVASAKDVLSMIYTMLKPGGVIVVRVPDMHGLLIRVTHWVDRLTGGRINNGVERLWHYHTFGFTQKTLANFLSTAGFEIVEMYGEHSKDIKTLRQKRWARKLIIRWGVLSVLYLARWLNMPDEMVAFARKSIA